MHIRGTILTKYFEAKVKAGEENAWGGVVRDTTLNGKEREINVRLHRYPGSDCPSVWQR
jgi:hypothetical protein